MGGGAEHFRARRAEESAPRRVFSSDYAEICAWYQAYAENPPRKEWLPAIGRIIPGVAAGFLYRTDSALGFIDCFIGNPAANREARQAGIEKVLVALESDAKGLGMKALYGNSKHASIIAIVKKHGAFVDEKPFFAIAKVL